MSENIFRAYDIRGIYPEELNESIAFKMGAAFGTINPGKIAVGCDSRLSSPTLKQKVIEGLVSTGANALDLGMITTPIVIFSTSFYNFDGGIIITASHNPKDYNGLKIFTKGSVPVGYDNGLNKVEELIKSGKFSKGFGKVEKRNVINDYENYLIGRIKLKSPLKLKIVIDAGNGAAGKIHSEILKRIGMEVVELCCEPDGNFPNHLPDPLKPENLEDIRREVVEENADMGFAFDGDGDRFVVIDGKGKPIPENNVFILLIKHTLQEFKNSKIVYNISNSMAVKDSIEKYNGSPVECRVGHTFVQQVMKEENAQFGGELSGHYFFKETFMGDDGIFAGLKLLEFFINNKTSFDKEFAEIPKYYSAVSENITIPIKESEKFIFIENLKKDLKKKGFRTNDMDGVKILFDDGWILFRPSNTTPMIRYGYESKTREGFERLKSIVDEIIKRVPR
jgi:phosphomannomutase